MNDTQRTIIRLLREDGAITRQSLARRLAVSPFGLSRSVSPLQEQGIVMLDQQNAEGRGRPSTVMRLAQGGGYALGISVQPRSLELNLVDFTNTTSSVYHIEAAVGEAGAGFKNIINEIVKFVKPVGVDNLYTVGLAFSGDFDRTTDKIIWTNDFASPDDVDLFRNAISSRFKVPVALIHDTDANLIAERWLTPSTPSNPNLLYINGRLGFSLMFDGQLVRGSVGWRHWLGDFPVPGSPAQARGFLPGSLAITSSINAFNDKLRGFSYGERSDWRTSPDRSNFEDLIALWKQSDPRAVDFVKEVGTNLGSVAYSLSLFLPLHKIVISGWPDGIQEEIYRYAQHSIEQAVERTSTRDYKITAPQLAISILGNRTEASGSAMWAIDQLLNPSAAPFKRTRRAE